MKKITAVLFSLMVALPVSAQLKPASEPSTLEALHKNIRPDASQQIQTEEDNFQNIVQTKRGESQSATQTHRSQLEAKLKNIKDEKKKTTVEQIDQSITDLNNLMTIHYGSVLDKLSEVLKRIISRTDKAQANGKDVTSVRTAIASAQTAITSARVAVAAQVGKTYSINITTSANLKNDVGAARQTLRDDLKKAEDAVKTARDAVHQAATALAQIPDVDKIK